MVKTMRRTSADLKTAPTMPQASDENQLRRAFILLHHFLFVIYVLPTKPHPAIMADTANSSYGGLLAFYEKSKSALAKNSVQFGMDGTNMVSKVAPNRRLSHFVSVLYEHAVATLILVLLIYFLDRLGGIGTVSLAGEVKVLGAIICMSGAALLTLCKEITITIWSCLRLKEGSASTDDNESNPEILVKGSVLLVTIFWGFLSQLSRPIPYFMSLLKRTIFLGLRLRKSRGSIVLLLLMIIAVASETVSSAGDGVPVGDKLPPSCYYVRHCGQCFPCPRKGQGFLCCDQL